jgi:hypothetical protein
MAILLQYNIIAISIPQTPISILLNTTNTTQYYTQAQYYIAPILPNTTNTTNTTRVNLEMEPGLDARGCARARAKTIRSPRFGRSCRYDAVTWIAAVSIYATELPRAVALAFPDFLTRSRDTVKLSLSTAVSYLLQQLSPGNSDKSICIQVTVILNHGLKQSGDGSTGISKSRNMVRYGHRNYQEASK